MLLSMTKVQILGTKRCQDEVVRLLYQLGVVQVDEWADGRPLTQQRMALSADDIHLRQRVTYAAARVEAVLSALPSTVAPVSSSAGDVDWYACPMDWLIQAVEADLEQAAPLAQTLAVRRTQLEDEASSLTRYSATFRQFMPLVPAIVELEQYAVEAIWVERRFYAALDLVTQQLEELTDGRCEVISREVEQDVRAAVLVFPQAQARAVNELLGRENITQVHLPAELAGQPFDRALARMRERLLAIPQEIAEVQAQQEALSRAWRGQLLIWQELLRDQLARLDVCAHFGETDYTFVVQGWVPEHSLAQMEAALQREVGDEVIVVRLALSADEKKQAPVMFDNPGLVKPFEPLMRLLALPRYGAFDPTPLMSLFLPLFFGLMLGDVAYGAILLVAMFYLRRRSRARPTVRALSEVLIMGSVWSILFGFVYGEFLGEIGRRIGMRPLFDRAEDVTSLFLITIGIGAVQVVLGLCLGVWQGLRFGNRHEALDRGGKLIALAGLFMLVAVITERLPAGLMTPGVALVIVGVALLIYSLGGLGVLLGPLELLSTVGNILSYLRIAAIGLSSVYLARVANELGATAGKSSLLLGIIIAVLFHALNLALGAFSPTIHSLRLHYVEFFTKFYESGGQQFHPFQRALPGRELALPATSPRRII